MTEIEAEVLAAAYTYSAALLALSFNPDSAEVQGEHRRAQAELLGRAVKLPPIGTWVKLCES